MSDQSKDRMDGGMDKAKEGRGKLTDDDKAEGTMDQAMGTAKQGMADVKDKVDDVVKNLTD